MENSRALISTGPIAAGASATLAVPLYAGPQEQGRLAAFAPGFDLVVDYGWLTIIAWPLFWLLEKFHSLSGNWGVAIILLTVTIKIVFFPLSAASYKSMAKMKLITPRLTKLREMYGNDRARMNQAMMELYKTEKINPLGGCFPILIQIPVFIALYWVLLAAIELRHAPFILWIKDLSALDPYYVLPVLMTATMVLQTRMNLEMAVTDEMLDIARRVRPADCCLVPERRQELTTEGGLDVAGQHNALVPVIAELKSAGIRVSLFINADERQIETAAAVGAPVIERTTSIAFNGPWEM